MPDPIKNEKGYILRSGSKKIDKSHLKIPEEEKAITVSARASPPTQENPLKSTDAQQLQKLIQQLPGTNKGTRTELMHQIINLVMQMGSDSKYLGKGGIDQRKFSVINELEQVSLGHFSYRGEVDGIRYFSNLVDWILNTSPSIGGLRARQTIQLTAAATGSQSPELIQKPGILARTLWKRDWKEKAEREGKQVVE